MNHFIVLQSFFKSCGLWSKYKSMSNLNVIEIFRAQETNQLDFKCNIWNLHLDSNKPLMCMVAMSLENSTTSQWLHKKTRTEATIFWKMHFYFFSPQSLVWINSPFTNSPWHAHIHTHTHFMISCRSVVSKLSQSSKFNPVGMIQGSALFCILLLTSFAVKAIHFSVVQTCFFESCILHFPIDTMCLTFLSELFSSRNIICMQYLQ